MRRPGLKMRCLLVVLAMSSLLLVTVKLFTYEFYLPDDPTCGIALRTEPMLESKIPLRQVSGMRPDTVLLQDENDFVGAALYGFTVHAGWMLALLLTGLMGGTLLFRRPASSY